MATDPNPIQVSAPPARNSPGENLRQIDQALVEQLREDAETLAAAEEEEQYYEARGTAPQVLHRHVARISNRFNYNHYYIVPASTYLMHGADYIRCMQDEGCDLSDIQITFEVQEIRIP